MNVTIDLNLLNAALSIISQFKPENIGQTINCTNVLNAIQDAVAPQIKAAQDAAQAQQAQQASAADPAPAVVPGA
jgi:hypothetical protein